MASGLINRNSVIYKKKELRARSATGDADEYAVETIDRLKVFSYIRDIRDPERSYTLGELRVVTEDAIEVDDKRGYVRVTFTLTLAYCAKTAEIGLSLMAKLMRSLPPRYKIDVRIAPGSHFTEAAVNKKLNDKERVAASFENPCVVRALAKLIGPSYYG